MLFVLLLLSILQLKGLHATGCTVSILFRISLHKVQHSHTYKSMPQHYHCVSTNLRDATQICTVIKLTWACINRFRWENRSMDEAGRNNMVVFAAWLRGSLTFPARPLLSWWGRTRKYPWRQPPASSWCTFPLRSSWI